MNKVLLLDWDPHGEKYYLYFFLKENTIVDVWNHDWYSHFSFEVPALIDYPDFNEYDLLIFPVPYCFTKSIYDEIKKQSYHGMIIIEKMISDSIFCFDEFCCDMQKLSDCSYFIMHQRLYTPIIKQIVCAEDVCVKWPISYTSGMDCFKNILPNFLDEYYKCQKKLPHLNSVKSANNRYYFTFDNISLLVYPDESKCDNVNANGVDIPWPNVFSLMPQFLQSTFHDKDIIERQILYERKLIEYINYAREACVYE